MPSSSMLDGPKARLCVTHWVLLLGVYLADGVFAVGLDDLGPSNQSAF